jgi:hypothetical protein
MINWPALFLAVAMIESANNPKAIKEDEQAYGIFQIRQDALTDFNGWQGTEFVLQDFILHGEKSVQLSKIAFYDYGKHYGAKTPEQFYRIWNGGPDGMKKNATRARWERVNNLYQIFKAQKYPCQK